MKKILSLLLVLIMVLSLCACGPADAPDTSPSDSTAAPTEPSGTAGQTEPSDDTVPTEPSAFTSATEPTAYTEPAEPTGSTEATVPPDLILCQHEYSRRETPATCTETGLVTLECVLCGDVTTEQIPALGHRYTDASCTKAKTCSVCGSTDGSALGHSYVSGKCTRCGVKMPGYEEQPTGCSHNYLLSSQTAPTCTAEGTFTYTCSKCGASYVETVAANGHYYADATCEKAKTCTVCGKTSGTALGHNYVTGACTRCGEPDPSAPVTVDFKVTVRSDKGDSIEGVTVHIYTTGSTPAATGKTDSKGAFSVTLEPSSTYKVILSDVPSKYSAKESYTFSYHIVNINLTTIPVISSTDHSQANYQVGSTMGDFTLTDTDGISYTLSELLKEKELILLDFWFVNCGPCKSEFPYFESICEKYADKIQLLTLDPLDSESSIKALRQELGYTFPMIRETIGLQAGFGVMSYPTMVFIDSSGTIVKIEKGAYKSEQELIDDIERFL